MVAVAAAATAAVAGAAVFYGSVLCECSRPARPLCCTLFELKRETCWHSFWRQAASFTIHSLGFAMCELVYAKPKTAPLHLSRITMAGKWNHLRELYPARERPAILFICDCLLCVHRVVQLSRICDAVIMIRMGAGTFRLRSACAHSRVT